MINQYSRTELLIGSDGLEKLKNSRVAVFGVGGVGGFTVEALARSGVGTIDIIDNDTVSLTNINRQIIATHSTVGKLKVDVMEERIKNINKECNVIKYDLFFDSNTKDEILNNKIDFIVDSCDSVNSKKLIIEEALKRKIDFISSMGTANKLDPTKLEITDIRKTVNDPLARIMRKFVKDSKIKDKVVVLSSTELPKKNGTVLGSVSFVPSSAGLLITSYIINKIIK